MGLGFAVMEESVRDLQSYRWNSSGILIPDKSLEWAHGTVGPM